ncbi:MAG: hypothetical protein NT080_00820 [Spirochaetes bacterium]|nr:hypothetical protein [Spirochaetota bacterium]
MYITERRRVEAGLREVIGEKGVLFAELGNRVSGSFGWIASPLALEMDSPAAEGEREILMETKSRIEVMETAYDRIFG